jgi:hypothetical protein
MNNRHIVTSYLEPLISHLQELEDICNARTNASGDIFFRELATTILALQKFLVNTYMCEHLDQLSKSEDT